MNINLHIERLVLNGVNIPACQRNLLQAGVITELTRMLTEGGLSHSLTQGADLQRMSTGVIQLISDKNSMQLGQQIAKSVYGGIGHE